MALHTIHYSTPCEDGTWGRNRFMLQGGIQLERSGATETVHLYPMTSKGAPSNSARLSIPVDAIDRVIEALQSIKEAV